MTTAVHRDLDQRRGAGQAGRESAPLSAHAALPTSADRRDPVELLVAQNATRESDLVPVRHGRMMISPFTFYRGAAAIMAADLARTPTAGLVTQLCGDAHLSNFGLFGSPERRLIFGLNDFDETLPGPFEFDVKRMAASFVIAARNNGHSRKDQRSAARGAAASYRQTMAGFAEMRALDVWYAHLSSDDIRAAMEEFVQEHHDGGGGKRKGDGGGGKTKKKSSDVQPEPPFRNAEKTLRKAVARTSELALSKLAEVVDGRYRIASRPPIVIPARDLGERFAMSATDVEEAVRVQFERYRESLPDDRRHLLDQFEIVDMARKVVGVGSVGTRAFIVLLRGRDDHDPLFLQVKEATASVLEGHLAPSRYQTPGERVVQGQRMMQTVSDGFLGWTTGIEKGRYFYWRQLWDMKGSAVVEAMGPPQLAFYAQICGWTLARAHARSGDPVAIAEYLGDSDEFDRAVGEFSEQYADQNERDYTAFTEAARTGRIDVVAGV